MTHGGQAHHGGHERRKLGHRPKDLTVKTKKKKNEYASLKNQIRSTERFLSKDLPPEIRVFQQKKLEELTKLRDAKVRLAVERKQILRDKKIKFFERQKVERKIRRLEKQQHELPENTSEEKVSDQLAKHKEDLEYIKFFPRTEKYISLFVGGKNSKNIERRKKLHKLIKGSLEAAAANGKEIEETGSDDGANKSEDDFFFAGSSSDEAGPTDERKDISIRETASCASGKATYSISNDKINKKSVSEPIYKRPSWPFPPSRFHTEVKNRLQTFSSFSQKRSNSVSNGQRLIKADHNSNSSSTPDARKPRRKRRPKKKKQTSLA